MSRVALVGAGNIARVHAEALRSLQGVRIAAIVDPSEARAAALARDFGNPPTFSSAEEAIAADAFDRAHVLVPPDRHAEIGAALIAAGKPALLEKPLAHTAEAARALEEQGRTASVVLGVNQNFVHHPAFLSLQKAIRDGLLGRPRHVGCIYNVPLRQMAARQFGHWMFAAPVNLLLEQAVHPLSQIAALVGPIGAVEVAAEPPCRISAGRSVYPRLDALLAGAELNATLRFAAGESFPLWQLTVVGDDGVGVADILGNRFYVQGRTRWLETADNLLSGARAGAELGAAGVRNGGSYALSMLRLKPRSDPFYRSMGGSIAAFHAALDAGERPALDASFGAMLVEVCERIAARLPAVPAASAAPRAATAPAAVDIAVLGGTGFIGAHFVRRCLERGLSAAVMARSTSGLPDLFDDPRVTVHRGDIADQAAVARAIAGAPVVVNLAHGGGGATRAAVAAAMAGG
ncbi:MAG: Gfo/Idh/MocA family oxidoreductase, partial [Acetobacteraceae bacterium]